MKLKKCDETDDKLHKVSGAAEITGMTQAAWRSWILHRKVTVVRLGRSVRIPQSEIERLIREGMCPARTQVLSERMGGSR